MEVYKSGNRVYSIITETKRVASVDIILAYLWAAVFLVAYLCQTMITYTLTTMHVQECVNVSCLHCFSMRLMGNFDDLAHAANLTTANLPNQGFAATNQRQTHKGHNKNASLCKLISIWP